MKALIIGGDRNGEWVETLDGTQVWVDIRNAVQHRIRLITWNIQDVASGEILEAFTIYLAVHQDLLGPNEPMVGQQLLTMIAMNEFVRAHGTKQEIPKEPAGSSLIVPGSADR